MDDKLEKEYRTSRLIARIGSLLLSVFTALSLIILMFYSYAFIKIGITDMTPRSFWIISFIGCLANLFSYLLPARFMYLFAKRASQYSTSQICRLAISGVLFVLSWLIAYTPGPSEDLIVIMEPVPLALGHSEQPGFMMLAIGILVICIAGTLRYAAALKEDSESIL